MSEQRVSKKNTLISKIVPKGLKEDLFKGLFIAVGDTFYKATAKSIISRDNTRKYYLDFQTVNKETIKDIYGKDSVRTILTEYSCDYDEPIPCNIREDYKFIVDGIAWNTYNYPVWDLEDKVKNDVDLDNLCPATMKLFRHIYDDKLMLALDYATIEFMNPMQPLPIQILFSVENETGKSTILNHRGWIYGKNGATIDSDTFEDKFNGMIVGKNFVGIDEGKLKDEHAIEKIKMRVTAPSIPYRAMRKTAIEIKNFGKYFIATNLLNFAKLSKEDKRFWVISVNKLSKDDFDLNFDVKLKNEIPIWLGFLRKRWELRGNENVQGLMRMETPKSLSRLWFVIDQFYTNTFKAVVLNSLTFATKTFLNDIIEFFDFINEAEDKKDKRDKVYTIYATVSMIKEKFYERDVKMNVATIKNVLEKDLHLSVLMNKDGNAKNINFKTYLINTSGDGTCYNIKRIRRRLVYKLDYFDLVMLRDGVDIRDTVDEYEEVEDDVKVEDDVNYDLVEEKLPF